MGLIDSRDPDKGIIEGRFITAVLNDQASSILSDSKAEMRRRRFRQSKWEKKSATVNNNELTYNTASVIRFVDMKTRMVKKGYSRGTGRKVPPGKKRKKQHPVHNRIIWRHKKFIIRTLSFGFTDEVKESFRELAKNEGLIM